MNIVDLGVMPYSEALAVQLECHERVRQGEEDTLFLVEHPPVITFGRHGGEENLLLGRAELAARGVEIVKIAQHTLLDFYLYVNPAVAGDFSGDIAAIRGHFFAIYQFLLYAATNNFKESLLE